MKRKVKFYRGYLIREKVQKVELSRLFLKSNNLVFAHRKASLSFLVNRCFLTGFHGYLQNFGMSRQTFRSYVNKGFLPGVRKASW